MFDCCIDKLVTSSSSSKEVLLLLAGCHFDLHLITQKNLTRQSTRETPVLLPEAGTDEGGPRLQSLGGAV